MVAEPRLCETDEVETAMAGSEGDGTPRTTPSTREEEEEVSTPVNPRTATGRRGSGVSPQDASESSPTGSAPVRPDDQQPVTRRDLAKTRRTLDRAIGVSLKNMNEEFSQLLMDTQQECNKRIEALMELLIKDREVTANLINQELSLPPRCAAYLSKRPETHST